MNYYAVDRSGYISHHGILGMKWGVRRYQNPDGSLTPEGQRRYNAKDNFIKYSEKKSKHFQDEIDFYKSKPSVQEYDRKYGDGTDRAKQDRWVKENVNANVVLSDEVRSQLPKLIREYRGKVEAEERTHLTELIEAKKQVDDGLREVRDMRIEDFDDDEIEMLEAYAEALRKQYGNVRV